MAALHRTKQHGRDVYRLSWYDKAGRRKSIRLGDIGRKAANTICQHVTQLADLADAGHPIDGAQSTWLDKISQDLADKLAAAGLIRERQSATLAEFIDAYLETRKDMKANSIRIYRSAGDSLVAHFGAGRNLRDINAGEAQEWRQAMANDNFAEATISKRVKVARQFFKIAMRKGIVSSNPFAEIKAGGERNVSRMHFIDRATIDKVLNATADPEWQLIIALSRFGGLRCPSETLSLKFTDINWAEDRLTVPSPKTAHQGKPFRIVPLFLELKAYLLQAAENAPDGAVYCISRYRDPKNANLRTGLLRILRRAGVKPWERLFHNLRASRQTELCNEFPSHVVAEWLGNTPDVADKHYLLVTEHHFEQAVKGTPKRTAEGGATGGAQEDKKGGADGGAAPARTGETGDANSLADKEIRQKTAVVSEYLHGNQVHPEGLEPPTLGSEDRCSIQLSYGCKREEAVYQIGKTAAILAENAAVAKVNSAFV
jgi:integrase